MRFPLRTGPIVGALAASLLLVGCSQTPSSGPDSVDSRNPGTNGKVVQGAEDNVALDCSSALSVSVALQEGVAYTLQSQVSLLVDQPVRIVVQSDAATLIDLRGSETYDVIEVEPGLTAVCTTYRTDGQYPVQIGDSIPFVFVIDSP